MGVFGRGKRRGEAADLGIHSSRLQLLKRVASERLLLEGMKTLDPLGG